jgi:hypothetical protein
MIDSRRIHVRDQRTPGSPVRAACLCLPKGNQRASACDLNHARDAARELAALVRPAPYKRTFRPACESVPADRRSGEAHAIRESTVDTRRPPATRRAAVQRRRLAVLELSRSVAPSNVSARILVIRIALRLGPAVALRPRGRPGKQLGKPSRYEVFCVTLCYRRIGLRVLILRRGLAAACIWGGRSRTFRTYAGDVSRKIVTAPDAEATRPTTPAPKRAADEDNRWVDRKQ